MSDTDVSDEHAASVFCRQRTEQHRGMIDDPTSCSRHSVFTTRPPNSAVVIDNYLVFCQPRKLSEIYFRLDHSCFLLHPFELIIS
jgi:hypothetical protein